MNEASEVMVCPPPRRDVFLEAIDIYAAEAGVYLRPSNPYDPLCVPVPPELLVWIDNGGGEPIRPDGPELRVAILALAFARCQEETTQFFFGTTQQLILLRRAFARFGDRVAVIEQHPGNGNTVCIFRCPAGSELRWHVFCLMRRNEEEPAGRGNLWILDTA